MMLDLRYFLDQIEIIKLCLLLFISLSYLLNSYDKVFD